MRLTESGLRNIIRSVLKESFEDPELRKEIANGGGLAKSSTHDARKCANDGSDLYYNNKGGSNPLSKRKYGGVIPRDVYDKLPDEAIWILKPYTMETNDGDYIVLADNYDNDFGSLSNEQTRRNLKSYREGDSALNDPNPSADTIRGFNYFRKQKHMDRNNH